MLIKNHSSPAEKIIVLSDMMKQLLANSDFEGADYVLNVILYALIKLGRQGAEFYLDYLYITSFTPEGI